MTEQQPIRYMLDTNTVSYFIKGSETVRAKIILTPMSELSISAITAAELWFGLANNPFAKQLRTIVHEFLIRVDVLPWDAIVAECYGTLRAKLHKKGKLLGNLDLLIAAHALALDLILVTADHAFFSVEGLKTEDWTKH